MNVVLLSTYLSGGAGGSARVLHEGLLSAGVTSTIVTRDAQADDDAIVAAQTGFGGRHALARRNVDRLPKLRYPRRERSRMFHPQWLPDRIPSQVARLRPDVVNLRWVCDSFLSVGSIARLRAPIVWTLSDMWPFTGGCFYSETCDRFTDSCGACPILGSTDERDLSRSVWRRKERAWRDVDLTVVAPSAWLVDRARASGLFGDRRIERIPSGVDLERFKPQDRARAREAFGLPIDRHVLLFSAWGDPRRKGLEFFRDALQRLPEAERVALEVAVAGMEVDLSVPGVRIRQLGRITDQDLNARLYSAADATVVPSTWDNLPRTALESIACGTPVVAFNSSGLPDVVDHGENGYLAQAFDTEDLAKGIAWVLADRARSEALSRAARAKAIGTFSVEEHVRRYVSLFDELIARRGGT